MHHFLSTPLHSSQRWLLNPAQPWRLPLSCWLASRALILFAFLGIAPLFAPEVAVGNHVGVRAFFGGDGEWYLRIATEGYTVDADGALRSPAFFPLLPLLIRLLMVLQIPPEIGGCLINNLAFLGAVLLLHHWLMGQYGLRVARWAVAVLTFFPLSVFGTVLYTEGLFLCLTTLTLYAFETRRLGLMSLGGVLATASRPPGLVLIPALLLQAWREGRSRLTIMAILVMGGGLCSYSLFCWWQLGHPLAFSQAQDYWGRSMGDLQPWLRMFLVMVVGETNYHGGGLIRVDHPLAVLIVTGLAVLVWFWRDRLGKATPYWAFLVVCACWIVGDYGFLRIGGVFGGALLLWHTRHQLTGVVMLYGFGSLGLLLMSGSDLSAERYVYGIIPLTIAAGIALAERPRLGYGLLPLSAIALLTMAIQLGQGILVA